jgi:hypothetical protein
MGGAAPYLLAAGWAVAIALMLVCALWILTPPPPTTSEPEPEPEPSPTHQLVSTISLGTGRSRRVLAKSPTQVLEHSSSSPSNAGGIDLRSQRAASAGRQHSLFCCLGVVLGGVGFWLTLASAEMDVCERPDGEQSDGTLLRWPSTISEINSDFASGRGRMFFAFMLVTSGFLYKSHMPNCLDTPQFENELRGDRALPDRILLHARALVVPIGTMFVGLCPTVNFWNNHDLGAGVTQKVHLAAAGVLFLGGTVCELWRLRVLARKWSEDPGRTLRTFFLNEPWADRTGQRHTPLGPIRPFLVACLVLNMVAITPDTIKDNACTHRGPKGECDTIHAMRGELVLSPVGTAYCPAPDYSYARLETFSQCTNVSQWLSRRYEISGGVSTRTGGFSVPIPSPGQNSSLACFIDGARVDIDGTGAVVKNWSPGECLVSNFNQSNASEPLSSCGYSGDRSHLSFESCMSDIILPQRHAICVCQPKDQRKSHCEWNDRKSSSIQMRTFGLEASLVVFLLFNYAVIALEHEISSAAAENHSPSSSSNGASDATVAEARQEGRIRITSGWRGRTLPRFAVAVVLLATSLVVGLTDVSYPGRLAAILLILPAICSFGASVRDCAAQYRGSALHLCRACTMLFIFVEITCTFARYAEYRNRQEHRACNGGGNIDSCHRGLYNILVFMLKPNNALGEDAFTAFACIVEISVGFVVTVVVCADAFVFLGDVAAPLCCGNYTPVSVDESVEAAAPDSAQALAATPAPASRPDSEGEAVRLSPGSPREESSLP